MTAGLPDRVDCARLADEGVRLQRDYALSELPRLQDLLADKAGVARATFVFAKVAGTRPGATVSLEASPRLVCQRCTQGYTLTVAAASDIEFVASESDQAADSRREMYVMNHGLVSLRELAEEEFLLALPAIAACATPATCGRAPILDNERSRPFAALQDLLRKT